MTTSVATPARLLRVRPSRGLAYMAHPASAYHAHTIVNQPLSKVWEESREAGLVPASLLVLRRRLCAGHL